MSRRTYMTINLVFTVCCLAFAIACFNRDTPWPKWMVLVVLPVFGLRLWATATYQRSSGGQGKR